MQFVQYLPLSFFTNASTEQSTNTPPSEVTNSFSLINFIRFLVSVARGIKRGKIQGGAKQYHLETFNPKKSLNLVDRSGNQETQARY